MDFQLHTARCAAVNGPQGHGRPPRWPHASVRNAVPQPPPDNRRKRHARVPPLSAGLLLALLAWLGSGAAFAVGATVVALWGQRHHPNWTAQDLQANHTAHLGTVHAVALAVRTVALVVLTGGLMWVSRRVPRHRLLAWRRTGGVQLAAAACVGVLVAMAGQGVAATLGAVQTLSALKAGGQPAWLFLVIWLGLACVMEELFYRGGQFLVVRHSQFCGWGAGAITSLWWVTLYWFMDPVFLAQLFGLGMLLGISRQRTRSVWPGVAMAAAHHAAAWTLAG